MISILNRAHNFSKGNELILVRLFLALGLGAIETVWAVYMSSLGLSVSAIGFISSLFLVFSLLFAISSTPILEKFKQTHLLIMSLILSIISYLVLGFSHTLILFIIFALVIIVANVLRTECFNIIFRDNVSNKDLNGKEGLMYALLNVGWLIGPLIAGFFMINFGISSVFFVVALLFIIGYSLFLLMNLKSISKKRKKIDDNIFRNIKSFIKNKKMRSPYFMTLGIKTWWSFIYIYMPLFILYHGFGATTIAIFLSAIIIPLVLFERQIGQASLKFGFKRFFLIGYAGLMLTAITVFFIPNIIVQLILLVLASIFAAFIEPIQETFFFKRTKTLDEEKYYPIFSTSRDVGGLIGKLPVALILLFLANKFAYLTLFAIMAIFFLLALRIKE